MVAVWSAVETRQHHRLGLNIGWSVVGSGGEKKVGKGEVDGGSGWWARGAVALAAG